MAWSMGRESTLGFFLPQAWAMTMELQLAPFVPPSRPAQRITVEARSPAVPAAETGAVHFFKEHAWGYGMDRRRRLLRYAVDHPTWRVHPEAIARLELDFGAVYGAEWSFLTGQAPEHLALAEGSQVAVYPPERLQAA